MFFPKMPWPRFNASIVQQLSDLCAIGLPVIDTDLLDLTVNAMHECMTLRASLHRHRALAQGALHARNLSGHSRRFMSQRPAVEKPLLMTSKMLWWKLSCWKAWRYNVPRVALGTFQANVFEVVAACASHCVAKVANYLTCPRCQTLLNHCVHGCEGLQPCPATSGYIFVGTILPCLLYPLGPILRFALEGLPIARHLFVLFMVLYIIIRTPCTLPQLKMQNLPNYICMTRPRPRLCEWRKIKLWMLICLPNLRASWMRWTTPMFLPIDEWANWRRWDEPTWTNCSNCCLLAPRFSSIAKPFGFSFILCLRSLLLRWLGSCICLRFTLSFYFTFCQGFMPI